MFMSRFFSTTHYSRHSTGFFTRSWQHRSFFQKCIGVKRCVHVTYVKILRQNHWAKQRYLLKHNQCLKFYDTSLYFESRYSIQYRIVSYKKRIFSVGIVSRVSIKYFAPESVFLKWNQRNKFGLRWLKLLIAKLCNG